MKRGRYLAFRTLQTVFLLWLILTFLFFFFRLLPGNFLDVMMFRGASPETIAAFEEKWGLNEPLYVQYWHYLVNFLQFDVGESLQYNTPVFEYVKMKIFNSFILVAPAITFTYLVGAILGTGLGSQRGSRWEKTGIVTVLFGSSFPSFFIAIVVMLVFAIWLGLFPVSGMFSSATVSQFRDASWWRAYLTLDFAIHYALPFGAIVVRYLAFPTLIMRTSVVEVLGQEFTYYHRMTGLNKTRQLFHVAKHSSLPVITLYPIAMTRAFGGLVLIEVVFNWPGMGAALIESVLSRDYPVVQFVFFVIAAFVVIANFLVDILYGIIDPRVSVED